MENNIVGFGIIPISALFVSNKNRKIKEITYNETEKGCWVCDSHSGYGKGGYPIMNVGSKPKAIGKILWEHVNGRPFPKNEQMRHNCDVPKCINPDHITYGTSLQNAEDKLQRDRQAKGSSINHAKLNESDVRRIKRALFKGVSRSFLARKFSVDYTTICDIATERTWEWVDR